MSKLLWMMAVASCLSAPVHSLASAATRPSKMMRRVGDGLRTVRNLALGDEAAITLAQINGNPPDAKGRILDEASFGWVEWSYERKDRRNVQAKLWYPRPGVGEDKRHYFTRV